jgi:tetratricopeptide (TPR) repeat protein
MVETLIRLMEEGEFERCLHLAEQLWVQGDRSLSDKAKINLVICRCRLGSRDPLGAIEPGILAVEFARDGGEYDLLGRALLNLGTAYVGVHQYDNALAQFEAYLSFRPQYKFAGRLEGAIWKHIGVTYQRMLESQKALEALERARGWFAQRSIDHSAFTCTHDMINTYFQMHETDPLTSLEPVRPLLTHQKVIARRNAEQPYYLGTYLLDLAAFSLHEGKIAQVEALARQASLVYRGDRIHLIHCEMLLHRAALEAGNARGAVGHALAAWIQAAEGRLTDLEFLACQAMADVLNQQRTETVRRLDQEYLAMGVDLGLCLSPGSLRRDAQ